MGEVYEAHDAKLDAPVALKLLKPELGDEEHRQRFLREARAAAAVTHPFIVSIHNVDEADGTLFMAMELVQGQTIRSLLARGALPIADAQRYATEIAEGLAHAHQSNLVHRDLKPDNVMVASSGHVKILDFGLAKLVEKRDEAATFSISRAETPPCSCAWPARRSKRSAVTLTVTFSGLCVGFRASTLHLAGRPLPRQRFRVAGSTIPGWTTICSLLEHILLLNHGSEPGQLTLRAAKQPKDSRACDILSHFDASIPRCTRLLHTYVDGLNIEL
jgi:hypothetical protein